MFKIKKEDTETVIRTIRVSKKLNKKLIEEARINKVSVSRFINEAIIYALENMDK